MTFRRTSLAYKIARVSTKRPDGFCDFLIGLLLVVLFWASCLFVAAGLIFFYHMLIMTPLASLFYSNIEFFQAWHYNPEMRNAAMITTFPVAIALYLTIGALFIWRKKICEFIVFE